MSVVAGQHRRAARDDRASDRRHTEHGRERKQQLVDAAAELFADHGYAATRIQDICQRAGVAKGLFYWYFPTKQELFAELVRSMRQRLRKAQAAAMDPAADALVRLRQGSEASVRFQIEHAGYFSLLDVERADAGHAALLREGGDVYLRDVLGARARGPGRRPDRRRRADRGAGPRRARRRVVVHPRLARRAHRPARRRARRVRRHLGRAGARRQRDLTPLERTSGSPAGGPPARIVSAMPPRRRSRQLEASAIAALGPVLVIAPFCLLALFVDLAARAARVGRPVLVVRRRLRRSPPCCCSSGRSRRSC